MSTVAVQARLAKPASRRRWTRRHVAPSLVVLWLLTGVYLIAPDQQAVETRFGRLVAPRVMPGLHFSFPWPIGQVTRLKVRQLQRAVVGGDARDAVLGRTGPTLSQFITGDQNIINMRAVVQYSVGVPANYLFRARDVDKIVAAAVEAELAHRIAHSSVDAVLITEKATIQDEVRAAAQTLIDGYGVGVRISTVNIETVNPPPEAADAFRDVASARADSARVISEAQGYANDVLPKARGEAQQMLESAEGYRQKRINEAAGDAARFSQVAAEWVKAEQVTGERLYVETMEQVLPKIRKFFVDKDGNFDLTLIRKGDAAKPAKP